MAVNDLLSLLSNSDIFAQAYGNEVVVSIVGKLTEVLRANECKYYVGCLREMVF